MFEKIIKLTIILLMFVAAPSAQAQMVVNTTILPPYSPYLSDYVSFGNKVVIMVSNPTQTMRSIKLMGSITGNGISITTSPNFQPPSPIIVQPMATIQVTGNQLAPYYNTDNLNIQGISVNQLINGNGLPEGTYTFCYYAADYNTGAPLSSQSSGCATIVISHLEPPFLIQPVCDNKVTPKTPQNLLFSWTVPAGANPTNVEYELTVVELLPGQNPNQALSAATDPVFFRKTVPVSSYLYSQVDPPLTINKKYAWRVRAKAKPGKTANFKNNGYSAACTFDYKPNSGGGIDPGGIGDLSDTPDDPNYNMEGDENACISGCEIQMPNGQNPLTVQVNDSVGIGKFIMIVKTINGSAGTGIIEIPFMKAKINVDFTGLQVNGDHMAFGTTKAIAKIDGAAVVTQSMAADFNGTLDLTRAQFSDLNNYVIQNNRLTSKFPQNMPGTGVPFAIDKNGMNLHVVGLIFTPTRGYMNCIYGYDNPDLFENDYLAFSKKGMCIRPNGYGEQPKITLPADKMVALSNTADIKYLKGANTFVELDCNGIKTVKLSGEYLFSRTKILPVENNKVVPGDVRTKVPFTVDLGQGGNFLADASLVPNKFTVPDAPDFRFSAESVVLDMHNTKNPSGIKIPDNHPIDDEENKDWKGVHLKSTKVEFPDGIKSKGNSLQLDFGNTIIDKTGFWMDIVLNDVMDSDQGDIGSWPFSIDKLTLNVQSSSLAGFSLEGDLIIPISETDLGYSASISAGDDGTEWEFVTTLGEDLEVDMWKAKLKLDEGSSVTLDKENGIFKPVASLNGEISVGFDESPNNETPLSKLSIKDIKFEELKVIGGALKPEIELNFISLENQEGGMFSMNKFPINLTSLTYDNGENPGISFGIHVNLSKGTNAFEADSKIKVKAKWNGGTKKFAFKGVEVEEISINSDLGVMSIDGSLKIYKDDPKYGTGFRGDIDATLKFASIGIKATIQLGKIGPSDQPDETNANYRYFYVDMSARWGVGGLPIPGVAAVAFYGFGGGLYRNMDRNLVEAVTNDKIKNDQGEGSMTAGQSRSGVVYTPQKGTFGFMASVTIGTTGEPTSFNGDVKLIVQFNTDNFSVTKLALEGNAYLMSPIADRDKRLVKIGINIDLDFEKPMLN